MTSSSLLARAEVGADPAVEDARLHACPGDRRSRSLTTGAGFGGWPLGSVPQVPASGRLGALGDSGRGGSVANYVGRGSTSAGNSSVPPEDVGGQEVIEEEDDNGCEGCSQANHCDKANWTEDNTYIFYDLLVEQIRQGNCLNGTMSNRGYKNLREQFFVKAGLRYSIKQLKNS